MSKPTVQQISPATGPSVGGTVITLTGMGFQDPLNPVVAVGFVGMPVRPAQYFTVVSDTEITAITPVGPPGKAMSVTVSWEDGTLDAATFTYTSSETTQAMMTLSGLAPTGATERPSGETVQQQAQRIQMGINDQLHDPSLSLAADQWTAFFVELTPDRANMAYIAQKTSIPAHLPQEFAVCIRGTVVGSEVDKLEDMDVTPPLEAFSSGPSSFGNISPGAMQAFIEITQNTTLVKDLTTLMTNQSQGCKVYVTGHSLGGCMATTVSLFLAAQTWPPTPSFEVYTFAAPTAGDAAFAAAFAQRFPEATCVWNQYDVVPQAWANLTGEAPQTPPAPEAAEYFFPDQGGGSTLATKIQNLIQGIADKTGTPNPYVQPKTQQQLVLNTGFSEKYQDPLAADIATETAWLQELGQQHANNTYLGLLGAQLLPDLVPGVTSATPRSGPKGGGTAVTIYGTNFTPDTVVDFGSVAGVNAHYVSDSQLTVTSPPGSKIVDVKVTSQYGTSKAVAADLFTYL